MVTLLLDGFDEVASQTVIRTDDKNFMRDARRMALQGIRDAILKAPPGVGIFICGRDHYFDNEQELKHALGLSGREFISARLDEFTEEGARRFLLQNGINHPLPDWLPRKPLLLSYLTQRGLLNEILQIDSSCGFGYCWDSFLTKIANREASLERAVMDPETLRSVMERLAFIVRSRPSGAGPITGNDLSGAYNIETRQVAGEGVLAQLQRLPGLTQRDEDPGARSFVDEDMLAALQGSAFSKFVLGQFDDGSTTLVDALSKKAISMAAYLLDAGGCNSETVISVVNRISSEPGMGEHTSQHIADCFSLALEMAQSEELKTVDFHDLVINNANLGQINLEEIAVTNVEIRNCIVDEVVLDAISAKGDFKFSDCIISKLTGVADRNGIPLDIFDSNCTIESFDDMGTNNAVLNTDLRPQMKALITILRKLYRQAGAGRKISALSRGIGDNEVLRYITPVINELETKSMISVFNKVVHPVRKQTARVDKILSAPTLSEDPVVKDVLKL